MIACNTQTKKCYSLKCNFNISAYTGADSGHVRVYKWSGSDWVQRGDDIDYLPAGTKSGYSISVSNDGNIVAIGSYLYDYTGAAYDAWAGVDAGRVDVYVWSDPSWIAMGQPIICQESNTKCGRSVSLSWDGQILATGDSGNIKGVSNGGRARIFKYDSGSWIQLGGDIYFGSITQDEYVGVAIALSTDGRTVAVGARGSATFTGSVRVFDYYQEWVQRGQSLLGTESNDNFGRAVALSADTNVIAIGATQETGTTSLTSLTGYATIYRWNSTTWRQVGTSIYGSRMYDRFGATISLSYDGLTVAIGAPYDDRYTDVNQNQGSVMVFSFHKQSNSWIPKGFEINGLSPSDLLGTSASLSYNATILAVGAPFNDANNNADSGQVKVYQFVDVCTPGEKI